MIDLQHGDCLELMKDIPDGAAWAYEEWLKEQEEEE